MARNPNTRHRPRTCEACGANYTPTYSRQRSCSRECGKVVRKLPRRVEAKWLPVWFKTCPECGGLFAAKRKNAVVCSAACGGSRGTQTAPLCGCGGTKSRSAERCRSCANAMRRNAAVGGRQAVRARRYRREAAGGLTIEERAVLLRQQRARRFWCQLCFAQPGTELDHVVPLVRGGSNLEGNLLLCCRSCNSRKGHRLAAEWRHGRTVPYLRTARLPVGCGVARLERL